MITMIIRDILMIALSVWLGMIITVNYYEKKGKVRMNKKNRIKREVAMNEIAKDSIGIAMERNETIYSTLRKDNS